MFLRAVRMLLVLLLITAESEQTEPNSTTATNPPESPPDCSCSTAAPDPPTAPPPSPSTCTPELSFITISWTSSCKAEVQLFLLRPTDASSSSRVCHSNKTLVTSLLRGVCEGREGCQAPPLWDEDSRPLQAPPTTRCHTLRLQCAEEVSEVQGQQLQVYKVLTALLCCVLVVLLLVRFCRPTVSALQRRLSDRRQSRWIGPTQSHSVSYHRGKAAVKQKDREDRLSYPALEQLAALNSSDFSTGDIF